MGNRRSPRSWLSLLNLAVLASSSQHGYDHANGRHTRSSLSSWLRLIKENHPPPPRPTPAQSLWLTASSRPKEERRAIKHTKPRALYFKKYIHTDPERKCFGGHLIGRMGRGKGWEYLLNKTQSNKAPECFWKPRLPSEIQSLETRSTTKIFLLQNVYTADCFADLF